MRQWAWIAGIFALLALIGFEFAAWGTAASPQGSGVLGGAHPRSTCLPG